MEPYYPVNDERIRIFTAGMQNWLRKSSRVIFGGRLAEYKYYDMDKGDLVCPGTGEKGRIIRNGIEKNGLIRKIDLCIRKHDRIMVNFT